MIKARLTSIQPNIFRKGNIWMGRGQTGSDSLMPLQHTQASGSITSSKKKKKGKAWMQLRNRPPYETTLRGNQQARGSEVIV